MSELKPEDLLSELAVEGWELDVVPGEPLFLIRPNDAALPMRGDVVLYTRHFPGGWLDSQPN